MRKQHQAEPAGQRDAHALLLAVDEMAGADATEQQSGKRRSFGVHGFAGPDAGERQASSIGKVGGHGVVVASPARQRRYACGALQTVSQFTFV